MQVELIELSEKRIRFLLKGVTPAFANAIRRASLSEVPTLAVDEINIYDNTSVLFDEQMALRLGLIPIQTEDLDLYVLRDDCECEGAGCPACQVTMMLSAEGPCTVHSGDIRYEDPGVKVAYENIPIVILGEGEKLVVEGMITLDSGSTHAKWQGGTRCGYKNLSEITIGECDGCGRCVEVCPRDVLEMDGGRVKVTDPMSCNLCKLCVKECDAEAIEVVPVADTFVMVIVTDGSISARDLVAGAAKDIGDRARLLGKKLGELA